MNFRLFHLTIFTRLDAKGRIVQTQLYITTTNSPVGCAFWGSSKCGVSTPCFIQDCSYSSYNALFSQWAIYDKIFLFHYFLLLTTLSLFPLLIVMTFFLPWHFLPFQLWWQWFSNSKRHLLACIIYKGSAMSGAHTLYFLNHMLIPIQIVLFLIC